MGIWSCQLQFSSFSGSLCCLSTRNNLMDILHLYFRSTRIVKKSLTFYAFCNHISLPIAEYFYRIRHKKTVVPSLQVFTRMWSGEMHKVFFLSTEAKLNLVHANSILTEKYFSTSPLFWITKKIHIFIFVHFAKDSSSQWCGFYGALIKRWFCHWNIWLKNRNIWLK